MDTINPSTKTGKQCNEIGRKAFYKSMEKALEEMDGACRPEILNALAAIGESAGSDFEDHTSASDE